MEVVIALFLFCIGTCFGSFLCCQARRLHHKSTRANSSNPIKSFRLSGLSKTHSATKLPPRSICLHCRYRLKWYDNIPIISWLVLKGKCRKCHHKIGLAELLSELSSGLSLVLIWIGMLAANITPATFLLQPPLYFVALTALVIFVALLLFLAIYDGLYGELPVAILTISVICAIIISYLNFALNGTFSWLALGDIALSVAILGGLYLILYLISNGRWVGDGDWILGVALGLVLGSPWLALLTLFLSNFLACLVMLPVIKTKDTKIPFGPFLVAAFIIVYSFSDVLHDIINLW